MPGMPRAIFDTRQGPSGPSEKMMCLPETGRLRGAAYQLGPSGLPRIDGCLAYLECAVRECLPGGDHGVFLGEPLHGDVARDAPPLLYYRGGYRSLAP